MINDLLSIVIPSRSERFLVPTVNSIFENARGRIECIVVLDGGEWPNPEALPERDNLIVIRHPESLGTRRSINDGVAVSSGDVIIKCDGHVLFDVGFDLKIKEHCDENTVVVLRRKRLDAENWRIEETSRPDIDYELLSWHPTDIGGWGHNIIQWEEKNRDESLKKKITDEAFMFQASCYAMKRPLFYELDLMDEQTYGPLMNEGEEICLKAWLSGRKVLTVKSTWYAHLWKGKRYGRGYDTNSEDIRKGAVGVRKWLTNSAWPGAKQVLPFEWLIEKFSPLPGWPHNWRELITPSVSVAARTNITPEQFADRVLASYTTTTASDDLRTQLLVSPRLIITKAEYGSDDKRKTDVTNIMREIIADHEGKRLEFCTGKDLDLLFGNPARGRRKRLSVWCTLDTQPYFLVIGDRSQITNDRSNLAPHGHGDADAALSAVHELDESDTQSSELSAPGFVPRDGSVLQEDSGDDATSEAAEDCHVTMNETLDRILHKFNLNRAGDYSKVSMPLGLRLNRRQLAQLFSELGFKVGAEIGTAEGLFAETLCKANPNLELYCVDGWTPYKGYLDYQHQSTIDGMLELARTRLASYLSTENRIVLTPAERSLPVSPYPLREIGEQRASVHLMKAFSPYAASCFDDGELDFCYIDANHKYEYVVADIAAWLPKVRSGGICAGHDYSHPKGKQFGVCEAVEGWCKAYAIAPWFVMKGSYEAVGDRSHSWMFIVP